MADRPGRPRDTDSRDSDTDFSHTGSTSAGGRDRLDGAGPDALGADAHTALPPRIDSWRKRSATGAILTGFALGLQQVFEPERKEPAIVQETSGAPPRDLPVEAELEGVVGRRSVVRIRPWLLDDDLAGVDPEADGDPSAATGVAPRAVRRTRRLRRRRR